MIEVKALKTRYHHNAPEVLHDVSFTLEEGKGGVVLGPNGAGKSTILKCLLGLLKYEGSIQLFGKELREMKPSERAKLIAYVPQNLSFGPSTVYDAVMVGRIPHFVFAPGEEDHRVVKETLAELGLEELADRNVMELSGGERQKVAIARALVQEAKVLIFDEPTSNLDIAAEQSIAKTIRSLCLDKGLTVLLSIHDLNLALSLGDCFALLKGGRIVAFGDESVVNEENIADVFGVSSKRVRVDNQNLIVFGGNEK